MGNGVTQGWTYNNLLQPTWIVASDSGGGIFAMHNAYSTGSNNGNVASQTYGVTAWVQHNYSYDGLNRLTQDASTAWTEQYAYDRYGNRAVTGRSGLPGLRRTGEKKLERIMRVISIILMLISLGFQGLYFWARDAVTPDPLPTQFLVSDWVWLITLCSVAFYWRYPWVTLICSWVLLFTVAVVLREFYYGKPVITVLIINSAAFLNLLFAHLGVHFRKTSKSDIPSAGTPTTPSTIRGVR